MKIIKRILLVLVILIAIPLIVALFLPKDWAVEREVTINKPQREVYDYIKFLKNQDKYSKWAMMDPTMKQTFTGTDGTVGFVSAWDGKEVGKGEQQIIGYKDGESMYTVVRFIEPFEASAKAHMETVQVTPTQTKVKWGMEGSTPYPFNFMSLIFNTEKTVGADLDEGLGNLKKNLEK